MQGLAAPKRRAAMLLGAALALGACAGNPNRPEEINVYPANYKADIVAAMHAYLIDPTGIRDASISEPVLKPATLTTPARYIACLRYNPKKTATVYAGMREALAVFLAGRFDQFVEPPPKDVCAGATYAPFPELEQVTR